jgi:hypothetical protein
VDTGLDAPLPDRSREAGTGNGGIVIYDGPNSQVISEVVAPALGQNIFWQETTSSFASAPRDARRKRLGNLSSVTMRNVLTQWGPRVAIMFTDGSGVYEIVQPDSGGDWVVRWMLTNEAYRVMRRTGANVPANSNPRELRAAYARRLDSGEVLVVNNFFGRTRGGQEFAGEVVQLDGTIAADPSEPGFHPLKLNLGFDSISVRYQLPSVQGTRSIVLPVFADRR